VKAGLRNYAGIQFFYWRSSNFPTFYTSFGSSSHHQQTLWRIIVSLEENTPSPSPHCSPDPQTYCIWPDAGIGRSEGGGGRRESRHWRLRSQSQWH
jgi:hypothetical protein